MPDSDAYWPEGESQWPGLRLLDTPKNWLLWGRLIEKWGNGYNGGPPDGIKTPQELIDTAQAHGVTLTVPKNITKVEFWAYDPNTLYVVLPNKSMITDGQDWMAQIFAGGCPKYPLPSFYDKLYDGERKPLSNDELVDTNTRRIGEYCINLCG